MLVNEIFLKAKKDENVRSLIIAFRPYEGKLRNYMYLCIDEKGKYTKRETVYVETDIEIKIDNYSHLSETGKIEVHTICFLCPVLTLNGYGHIRTFLKAITKNSQVSFRVVAYNGYKDYQAKGLVNHQLYGIVDERCYFLSDYVGADNSASPVYGTPAP